MKSYKEKRDVAEQNNLPFDHVEFQFRRGFFTLFCSIG